MNITPNSNADSPHAELRAAALHWLCEPDVDAKVQGVTALSGAWRRQEVLLDADAMHSVPRSIPRRPQRPELVRPLHVRHRSMGTVEGRAALIHASAHIEFNAINLALDAVWRFAGMPDDYYADWLRVAAEEALHFSLLSDHLKAQGFQYGDFPAHNSLWDMAEKTKDDVRSPAWHWCRVRWKRAASMHRRRCVPSSRRPATMPRRKSSTSFCAMKSAMSRSATVGFPGYARCVRSTLFKPMLSLKYKAPQLRGPFNLEARRAAGFSEAELAAFTP